MHKKPAKRSTNKRNSLFMARPTRKKERESSSNTSPSPAFACCCWLFNWGANYKSRKITKIPKIAVQTEKRSFLRVHWHHWGNRFPIPSPANVEFIYQLKYFANKLQSMTLRRSLSLSRSLCVNTITHTHTECSAADVLSLPLCVRGLQRERERVGRRERGNRSRKRAKVYSSRPKMRSSFKFEVKSMKERTNWRREREGDREELVPAACSRCTLVQSSCSVGKAFGWFELGYMCGKRWQGEEREPEGETGETFYDNNNNSNDGDCWQNCLIINCRKAKQSSKTWQQVSERERERQSRHHQGGERGAKRDGDKFLLKDTHGL